MKHSKEYSERINKWYWSSAWRAPRDAYKAKRIAIDGGMCELCGEEPGYIVDHIIELNESNFDDIDIRLNEDNFQFICHRCHNKKTFKKHEALEEGYYFDETGQLKYRSKKRTVPPGRK